MISDTMLADDGMPCGLANVRGLYDWVRPPRPAALRTSSIVTPPGPVRRGITIRTIP